MAEDTETAPTNKSIINAKYRDRYKEPDWLGEQIAQNCSATHTVQVEQKDADGKPTGKKVDKVITDGIDVAKLNALAEENGIDPTPYANMNAGQKRMNVGNRLRSLTLKRHGLTIDGEWVEADEDWLKAKGAPEKPTHDHDGTPFAKPAKEVKAAPATQASDKAQAKAEKKEAKAETKAANGGKAKKSK